MKKQKFVMSVNNGLNVYKNSRPQPLDPHHSIVCFCSLGKWVCSECVADGVGVEDIDYNIVDSTVRSDTGKNEKYKWD